ncbi:MAG TPA: hypothetical protein VGQ54_01110 [Burkholderiales bacterium]|jgi:hypothetical protein|nr:hypothetical protein [Burkholderiales bacterium]
MPEAAARGIRRRKHEPAQIDAQTSLLVALGVVGILITIALAMHALIRHFNDGQPQAENPPAWSQIRSAFPEPRLEPVPATEISTLNAEKRRLLNGYRWIDKEQGIIQIPIERAMQLLAERNSGSAR